MIPRNVISAWFGKGEKSDFFKSCIESWHRVLPDWKFIEMNEDTMPDRVMQSNYMTSVLERKEFVKATEVGRLVGLQLHGGVYLDADVEVLKPFDPLLNQEFFIAREDAAWINGAVIGSVPAGKIVTSLIKTFPLHTEGREGAHKYGPGFLTPELIALGHGFDKVLPPEYFYPYLWNQTREQAVVTKNTYAMHHWAKSWVGKY